jgi:hypothetical protein
MVFVSNISSVVKEANSVAGFGLDPQFAETLSELLSRCRAAGLDFRISQGLRTPQKQAEYYCKWVRRSPADIDAAARKMERDGAPWLASVLKSYRNIPRQQNWLTSQLPGSGWHQWGLAADCYCYRNGHMVENGSDPAYRFYAEQAVRLGLTAGYYFTHQDSGHVQGPSAAGATDVYTWFYIDSVMKERFSDKVRVALPSRAGVARTMSSIETVAIPQSALLAAASPMAATGPFYKDDPILAGTRLEPDFIYKLPASDSTLKRMAQTFNAIGGLVNTLGQRLGIDPVAVLAVWYVESGGRAFTPGKPVLRFENHKFFKYWGVDHEAEFDKHFQFGGHAGVPARRPRTTNSATDLQISGARFTLQAQIAKTGNMRSLPLANGSAVVKLPAFHQALVARRSWASIMPSVDTPRPSRWRMRSASTNVGRCSASLISAGRTVLSMRSRIGVGLHSATNTTVTVRCTARSLRLRSIPSLPCSRCRRFRIL